MNTIRAAQLQDCPNLTALTLQVWMDTYCVDGVRTENSDFVLSTFHQDYFEQQLAKPNIRILVLTESMYLRGFVMVNLTSHFQSPTFGFEIDKLYVHPPFQGQGIGKALLDEVARQFGDRFWLVSWVRNQSLAFYRHLGFKEIGKHTLALPSGRVDNLVLGYQGPQHDN